MRKIGIALSDDIVNRVEKPLEYGDSRSKRIRDLIKIGLIAEERLHKKGYDNLGKQDQIEITRKAIDQLQE